MKLSKKKLSGVFIIILSCACMLTGSLAWQDLSQHKTNNFTATGVEYSVVLLEDFKPIESWTQGSLESKKVSVRNGSDLDPSNLDYSEAYVRIQLLQYLETQEVTYVNSEKRYMVDTQGNFIRGDSQADIESQLTHMGLSINDYRDRITQAYSVYDNVDKDDSSTYKYYVETKADDINGVFGKHLVIDSRGVGTPESLIPGVSYSNDAQDNHNAHINNDDNYTLKTWDDSPHDKAFEAYIEFVLGECITITEWIESGANPVDKWIIDDISGDGWVYWGQALHHSQSAVTGLTQTTDFLEGVILKDHPGGHVFYQLHVNLDATSQSSMGTEQREGKIVWGDAPLALVSAFKAEDLGE